MFDALHNRLRIEDSFLLLLQGVRNNTGCVLAVDS